MANLSDLTRKDQILEFLKENKNEWVDGSVLATERVGGSEGLRRLRELRRDGHIIQQRRHPDPGRDIWQYRLSDRPEVSPIRSEMTPWGVPMTTKEHAVVGDPSDYGLQPFKPKRLTFGLNAICDHCNGKGQKHGNVCGVCDGRGWR